MDFDTSWCPVCDRQILPKRYLVPVAPPQPTAPTAPPSSPQSSSPPKNASDAPTIRRKSGGTIRARGGLVHGTGRVKPNGNLKRADSTSKQAPAPAPLPAAPVKPAAPIKHRTVIDQGPIPLYCSDECKMHDLANASGFISSDYDPHRQSLPLPPVPHNSFTALGSESDSTSSSSVDSQSSFDACSPTQTTKMSPSMATLAAMYNFPPLPPPAPIFDDTTSSSDSEYPREYNSGIMMANRRIEAALCPKPVKRSPHGPHSQPEPRKPIPGWTDGSDAWRAAVYSFSPPTDLAAPADPLNASVTARAYGSFVASPHRSRGVTSTLGERTPTPRSAAASASSSTARALETQELYSKYSQSLTRRSESRAPSSPTSSFFPSSSAPRRRERPLVAPGAEGKLLVPNVMMKSRAGSSTSLSSASSWSASSLSTTMPAGGSRRSVRSPLTRSESYGDASEEDATAPSVETRSWSYDNLKTYPVMQLPPRKEKRVERQVVNGTEVDVEVEVEVAHQFKRLFLFPGHQVSYERR